MTKLLTLASVAVLSAAVVAHADERSDALPSWSDGPTKSAIVRFVKDVTDERGAKYVPPEERVAVFDNDGTLWCEQPVVQIAFLLQRVKELAPGHPEWRNTQPFQAALEGDYAYLEDDFHKGGKGLLELVAATHLGMTQEEFAEIGRKFFQTARHPKLGVPYTAVAYQPMVELLEYLRGNGFRTYICSGGGVHFMRIISEEVYGIPPENVIGSHGRTVFELRNGKGAIVRKPGSLVVNDRAGKPVGIDLHVGRRPILAAGNVRSGGDVEMLLYSQGGSRPSLQIIINHDDATREYAYAEKDHVSLNAAKKNGWLVVSMKNDWRRIFRDAPR